MTSPRSNWPHSVASGKPQSFSQLSPSARCTAPSGSSISISPSRISLRIRDIHRLETSPKHRSFLRISSFPSSSESFIYCRRENSIVSQRHGAPASCFSFSAQGRHSGFPEPPSIAGKPVSFRCSPSSPNHVPTTSPSGPGPDKAHDSKASFFRFSFQLSSGSRKRRFAEAEQWRVHD